MRPLQLEGTRFGKLTVVRREGSKNTNSTWVCLCDCGQERVAIGSLLKSGRISCCGCSDGDAARRVKFLHPRLYEVWKGMKARCYNPKNISYKNYGGKGVVVCELWRCNSRAFIEWALQNGYKEGLFLDKDIIGTGKLYSPETCRFVTREENIRASSRIKMSVEKAKEIRDSNLSIRELADKFFVNKTTIESIKKWKTWR